VNSIASNPSQRRTQFNPFGVGNSLGTPFPWVSPTANDIGPLRGPLRPPLQHQTVPRANARLEGRGGSRPAATRNARSALDCGGSTPPCNSAQEEHQGGVKPPQSKVPSAHSLSQHRRGGAEV